MKKIGSLIIAILLTLALAPLVACSELGSGGSNSSGLINGLVDLENEVNYFIIVDGHKITLKTTIQDILNDGYTTRDSLDLNKGVEAKSFLFGPIYFGKDGETCFSMTAFNRADKTIPLSQCTFRDIIIDAEWSTNVSIVGGLTLGSSREDVYKVFGKDSSDSEEVLYYSSKGDVKRTFIFHLDDSGCVSSVRITSFQ